MRYTGVLLYRGSTISSFHLEGIRDNVILIDSVPSATVKCGIRIERLSVKMYRSAKCDEVCQARLCPPLIGQLVAEATLDAPETYMDEVYDEYLSRRNFMIEAINKIPGCYSPMPMGAFYTVARLPIDDADRFCAWLLDSFEYDHKTIMIAPASGFYSAPNVGRNEGRLAYVLNKDDLATAMMLLEKALEYIPVGAFDFVKQGLEAV